MSFFYMLDCGFSMFFGDRPRLEPYEIRHSLPTHEHVYQASSASEWSSKYVPTNAMPFPELLDIMMSPRKEFPRDVSAPGHFMLIHGKFCKSNEVNDSSTCGYLDATEEHVSANVQFCGRKIQLDLHSAQEMANLVVFTGYDTRTSALCRPIPGGKFQVVVCCAIPTRTETAVWGITGTSGG
jgi:hypothetical protein